MMIITIIKQCYLNKCEVCWNKFSCFIIFTVVCFFLAYFDLGKVNEHKYFYHVFLVVVTLTALFTTVWIYWIKTKKQSGFHSRHFPTATLEELK